MNMGSWMRILVAAFTIICASCLIGVVCFADDPDSDIALAADDDRSDSDLSVEPSTGTDISEELKEYEDEVSDMDGKIILLERGTVIVANYDQSDEVLRAPAASSSEVGYVIKVNSSIGSNLLVPSDYASGSFCLDAAGNLIGCRSSTFTCYIGSYSVRFPAYGQPQYRLTNGTGYTWDDIDLEYVSSSSVEVIGAHVPWWSDRFKGLVSVASLFFLVILALRRRD